MVLIHPHISFELVNHGESQIPNKISHENIPSVHWYPQSYSILVAAIYIYIPWYHLPRMKLDINGLIVFYSHIPWKYAIDIYIYILRFPEIGVPPKSSISMGFSKKPSINGLSPWLWKPPYIDIPYKLIYPMFPRLETSHHLLVTASSAQALQFRPAAVEGLTRKNRLGV